jgi:hypothetical protein
VKLKRAPESGALVMSSILRRGSYLPFFFGAAFFFAAFLVAFFIDPFSLDIIFCDPCDRSCDPYI